MMDGEKRELAGFMFDSKMVNLTLEGRSPKFLTIIQIIIVQTDSELVDWRLDHSTLLSRIQGASTCFLQGFYHSLPGTREY